MNAESPDTRLYHMLFLNWRPISDTASMIPKCLFVSCVCVVQSSFSVFVFLFLFLSFHPLLFGLKLGAGYAMHFSNEKIPREYALKKSKQHSVHQLTFAVQYSTCHQGVGSGGEETEAAACHRHFSWTTVSKSCRARTSQNNNKQAKRLYGRIKNLIKLPVNYQ